MRQTFGRRQVPGPFWNHLQQHLSAEVNNLFERLDGGNPLRAFAPSYPALNVWEEADNLIVEAELPGMLPNDIEILITGGDQLTLKGERKPAAVENATMHRHERGFGKFERTLKLPYLVDPDKVEARFENGVLRIQLSKHEAARSRKITVKGE
jgi:HSP20 family protein